MTLAGGAVRKQRGAQIRAPEPKALLAWYDKHRRRLPWRAEKGERPDPYAVWLSEIMLQQTTVKAVIPYYDTFLKRWPNVKALAAAPKAKIKVDYEIGDAVKVLEGPFASFNGVVEELDFDRSRVKVSVSIFGRATPVELEFSQIARL